VPDAAWAKAFERDAVIRPLLDGRRTRERIEQATKVAGVSRVTIYRWLNQFLESGGLASALLPHKPSGGRCKSRLPENVEEILQKVLDDYYLTGQKRKAAPTAKEVQLRCKAAGLNAPHANTIRKRIEWIPEERKIRRRFGAKEADHMFRVISGSFPNADWPLAVVQIDHTPLDIILVDELGRECVGRPHLTVVIDIYSRMVLGFYVSLDPPGDISTGLCLSQAILPKDGWLRSHDIKAEWPCWGRPGTVHADNAKEFRGNMLQLAAREHGFNLEWRVLGKPEYGAHIERWLGTLAGEIHTLPGSTFRSIAARGNYSSTKKAIFTLKEIETWLANHILGQYHNREHSGLDGDTPLERYEKGIFGTKGAPGRGLPDRIGNEAKLRMDFLPYFTRKIQHHGIEIDCITYFHPVLKTFRAEMNPATRRLKRDFIVRRDPRDISVVYLFDPKTQSYLDIPYRDASHPPISIWEWRATQATQKDGVSQEANEQLRFDAIEKMRAVEREAAKKTTKVRRNVERRNRNEELDLHGRKDKKVAGDSVEAPVTKSANSRNPKPVIPLRTTPVKAFDGIE
jgi:putative transposase